MSVDRSPFRSGAAEDAELKRQPVADIGEASIGGHPAPIRLAHHPNFVCVRIIIGDIIIITIPRL